MNLTITQKYELATLIDMWYFEWKDKIVDNQLPHKLGFAKEDLKKRLI